MQVPETVVWAVGLAVLGHIGATILSVSLLLWRVKRLEDGQRKLGEKDDAQDRLFSDWRHNFFQPLQTLVNRHDEYLERVKKVINGK